MLRIIICIFILCTFIPIFPVLTPSEISTIENMLHHADLSPTSLNFPKNWGNPSFIIPKMLDILEHPMQYPIFVNELKQRITDRNFLSLYDFASETVFPTPDSDATDANLDDTIKEFKTYQIKKPKDIMTYAENVYSTAEKYYQNAFTNLTQDEQTFLELFIYDLTKDDESEEAKYAHLYPDIEMPEVDDTMEYLVELIQKIDFHALNTSAKLFFAGMNLLANRDLSGVKYSSPQTFNSKWGKMIVGTLKNEVYTEDYVFIYDPAGYDIYCGNMSTSRKKHYMTVIDLGGDDIYRNTNVGQLFTAFYGHVFHYDSQGDDYYHGDDLSFSANIGSLMSIDGSGNDTYITGAKTLGAATMGIAFVINIGGNNFYSSTRYGQGFGGTLGLGLLCSLADTINGVPTNSDTINGVPTNNDVYMAGGKYLHAPLAPTDYQSLSQGFGFGVRPDMAGGIGILFDEAGNDFYNGGVYSQGVAYYYALGILIDLAGNDFYNAVYYPQGSGIHLAAGFLYDEAGDDMYYSKNGPGQGAGHDYGVGFLVDRAGNDSYSVDGGNGLGLSNSVGIFVDSAGNDRYERKRAESYGYGAVSREAGSIGIFLDMGGTDSYPTETQDNDYHWTAGTYGLGLDTVGTPFMVSETSLGTQFIASDTIDTTVDDANLTAQPDLDPEMPIAEAFSIASGWEVGTEENIATIHKAREILHTRETEATDYIFEKKLKTKSGLELRAIIDLAKHSEYFKEKLPDGLAHTHRRAVGNTIYIIGVLSLTEYLDTFANLLTEGKYVNSILSNLGSFGSDERSIDMLQRYIHAENVYTRVITAQSLKEIGTPRALNILLSLKDDKEFLIKSMIDIINATK